MSFLIFKFGAYKPNALSCPYHSTVKQLIQICISFDIPFKQFGLVESTKWRSSFSMGSHYAFPFRCLGESSHFFFSYKTIYKNCHFQSSYPPLIKAPCYCALPMTTNYFTFFLFFHMVFNNSSLFMSMPNLI